MQANHDKPRLIIVAGPNGSGKTTITREGLGHQWFKGCLYLNPDDIAQQEFSGWNDPQSSLKAAKKATKIRYEAIESHRSLALETVFSSPEKLEFIKYAKQQGYFIRLFSSALNPRLSMHTAVWNVWTAIIFTTIRRMIPTLNWFHGFLRENWQSHTWVNGLNGQGTFILDRFYRHKNDQFGSDMIRIKISSYFVE